MSSTDRDGSPRSPFDVVVRPGESTTEQAQARVARLNALESALADRERTPDEPRPWSYAELEVFVWQCIERDRRYRSRERRK